MITGLKGTNFEHVFALWNIGPNDPSESLPLRVPTGLLNRDCPGHLENLGVWWGCFDGSTIGCFDPS